MDRAREIERAIVERIDAGRPFAVVQVLVAEGSTPRGAGVRALVDAGGAIVGTIGGGRLEEEARRAAVAAGRTGRAALLEVSLEGVAPAGEEPICGGCVVVLIDPTVAKERGVHATALDRLSRRGRGLLVTSVERAGDAVRTSAAWLDDGDVPADLRECLDRESPRCFRPPAAAGERLPLPARFVEPLVPAPRLLIAGGGHIGQALAAQADALGFDVTVIDDRPEFTAAALYPRGVAARCGAIGPEVERFGIGPDTSVVIVTRGHREDAAALAAGIRSPAAYIGMIGSRRKVALLRADFLASGRATAEEFDRVFAPIGLDIGAVTVPEIATSIAAQLVAARRKGSGAARIGGRPR